MHIRKGADAVPFSIMAQRYVAPCADGVPSWRKRSNDIAQIFTAMAGGMKDEANIERYFGGLLPQREAAFFLLFHIYIARFGGVLQFYKPKERAGGEK